MMSMKKTKKTDYDSVISTILLELNEDQAEYQRIYRKYYGKEDEQAKHIHYMLKGLCDRIRKELLVMERK